MSEDTRMTLSGISSAFSVLNMSIRQYESFDFVAKFSVNFEIKFLTDIARISMAVLHPVVRSLIGIFNLRVL